MILNRYCSSVHLSLYLKEERKISFCCILSSFTFHPIPHREQCLQQPPYFFPPLYFRLVSFYFNYLEEGIIQLTPSA